MRKMLMTVVGAILYTLLHAQSVPEETHQDTLYAANNHQTYTGPGQASLTPAPVGMHAFYISHFGRHGSCAIPHDEGKRCGELTPQGARQQCQIAHRMYERFPEVFEANTDVDARSTTAGNCILSMEYFLTELVRQSPLLNIHHNATQRDMIYLDQQDKQQDGGIQPYTQRNLIHRIIDDADQAIQQKKKKVQLRFGHGTTLLPLLCLMDIAERAIPVSANLQLVFYRRYPGDPDVRFKVLLNEDETTLPLPTDMPPYYKWSDYRAFLNQRLDAYKEVKE